ncbi:hypothetical protein NC653_040374 [Populus alba x Populus x berolinensis]|uniref:Uncharacterized protein n=1 Tax=Populus alba x Populus x berolinensis TaxID=444605 RepID=A0AAD6LG68_9ROSI|nr:hypothetical protein NC653_040374 [Populus alba x Populus x berolinensis]
MYSLINDYLCVYYQVRDEIEHLLDDNEDIAYLYSPRKWIQNQQSDSLVEAAASGSITPAIPRLPCWVYDQSPTLARNGEDQGYIRMDKYLH